VIRALFCLPLLAACYRYAPIDLGAIRPGTEVRARVNATTAEQLEPLLGAASGRLLSGTLISVAADTLVVEVPAVLQAEVGSSIQTLHQRVSIPRSGLLEMESRTLDRTKTYAVAGAAALVVVGYVVKATIIDPGRESPPGGGGGTDFRVPIFFLRR